MKRKFYKRLIAAAVLGTATLIFAGCGSLEDASEKNTVGMSIEEKETESEVTNVPKEGPEKENDDTTVANVETTDEKTEATKEKEETNASEVIALSDTVKEDSSQDIYKQEHTNQEAYEKQVQANQEAYEKQVQANQEAYEKQAQAYWEEYEKNLAEYNNQLEEYNVKVEAHNKRVNNYYYNPTPMELANSVNISPGYIIYGDDGNLYARCFISNGLNRPAYNIVATYIELYDGAGNLIARDENIGLGNGGVIGAHEYATWDFVFSGDKIKMQDADLTNIINCKSGTIYNY